MPPSNKLFNYILFAISLIAYIGLAYYTERTQFLQLSGLFGVLFITYLLLLKYNHDYRESIIAAILFRLSLFIAIPNLSDDFYRFIWDGQLLASGQNPFHYLPSSIQAFNPALFPQLNSPDYYTIYPPICQFIFFIANKLFTNNVLGSVIVIRLFILTGELISIYLLHQLVIHFKLEKRVVLLYALNPLVIIELTGNLHFEALMITFLLLFLYKLINKQYTMSAVYIGLAISTKLIPLIFLPFLFKRLKWKKSILFYLITICIVLISFLPFIDSKSLEHLFNSISLYFQKFEYNASIYYIARWVGWEVSGYNMISIVGPTLSFITLFIVGYMVLTERNSSINSLLKRMMWSLTVYLLLATTVHPWYVVPLLVFCLFTRHRFAYIWSAVITLSYGFYYSYQTHLELIALEYFFVFIWIAYELKFPNKPINLRSLWKTQRLKPRK